jgi:hypothetical protein
MANLVHLLGADIVDGDDENALVLSGNRVSKWVWIVMDLGERELRTKEASGAFQSSRPCFRIDCPP